MGETVPLAIFVIQALACGVDGALWWPQILPPPKVGSSSGENTKAWCRIGRAGMHGARFGIGRDARHAWSG